MLNAPVISSTELGKNFRHAAFEGNEISVETYITLQPSLINEEGFPSGKTALHFAAQKGHLRIVQRLVENNALLDKKDNDWNTPLMLALMNKHFDVAIYLLENNCKVDTTNRLGMNSLHIVQLHLLEPQAIQVLQFIKLQIIKLAPLTHISKEGDIQPEADIESTYEALQDRFGEIITGTLPGKKNIFLLPSLLITVTDRNVFYPFLQEQLLKLNNLGYKCILREYIAENSSSDDNEPYQFIHQALHNNIVMRNFKVHAVGFSEKQRNQQLFRQKSAKFIANQLKDYVKEAQSGVILLLDSGTVTANEVMVKLPQEMARQCICYNNISDTTALESLSEQFSQLTISSQKDDHDDFWRPFERYLQNPKISQPYKITENATTLALNNRLKYIAEEFETVMANDKSICGLLPFNEKNPFQIDNYDRLAIKLKNKTGIFPQLKWSTYEHNAKPILALVVPDLSRAKPLPYFPQSKQSDLEFSNTINYWIVTHPYITTKEQTAFPSLERYTLKFSPHNELSIAQGDVAKIVLIKIHKNLKLQTETISTIQLLGAYLKIYFKDGSLMTCRMMFSFPPSAEDVLATYALKDTVKMMLARGAIVDQSLADQDCRRVSNWKDYPYKTYYSQLVSEYYQLVHNHIANMLLNNLPSEQQEITLFSFGCGAGKELITISKQLRQKNYRIKAAIGIDINQENFADQLQNNDGIEYVQGDILQLSTLLDNIEYDRKSFTIGLFLGALVAGIMDGTYQALQVLQQARNFNTIIVCGITVVLLKKETLKAAGFEVVQQQTDEKLQPVLARKKMGRTKIVDVHHIYYLTPMSALQRKHYLINRGIKRSSKKIFNCLDLSFSANPLYDIQLFTSASLAAIKQVDISWSFLHDTEIKIFIEQLDKLEVERLNILISSHQPGFDKVAQILIDYPKMVLMERLDNENAKEIPAFTPKEARTIGKYQDLPHRKLSLK